MRRRGPPGPRSASDRDGKPLQSASMPWLRNKVFDLAAHVLTKPRGRYQHLLPNDPEQLRRGLRPGDVILVDGDQRVSEVIKYLTQSSWSHSVLYIGDEMLRRHPAERREL